MKGKAAALFLLLGLVFGGASLVYVRRAASLPRIRLPGGGEFRVFQISYGTGNQHHLGGAPAPILWLWDHLPGPAKGRIPSPPVGATALVPGLHHTGLSIYWAYIDPAIGQPILGPSGDVTMTVDSGEQTKLGSPEPFDGSAGGGFRQIYVDEPPRDSSRLRFRVPVEHDTVEFTIENPAYHR